MFRPSVGELLVIALVVLLVFGSRRLPELGRALGAALKNFQKAMRGEDAPPPQDDHPPSAP